MRSALAFLTVLGGHRAPDATTLRWFPFVGALVGAAIAGVHAGGHAVWPPLLAGAFVLTADLVLTGALHVDGLLDTADGVLPHLPRERRLAVMADPAVGAFAASVLCAVAALRWSSLADPDLPLVSVAAVWAAARTLAAVVPAVVGYARPGGLASPFLGGARRIDAAWLVVAAAVAGIADGPGAAVAVGAAVAAGIGVVTLAHRRLGGFTGDVLGATIVVSETAGLVALGAR